jgi:hypothetical protein
MDAILLEGSEAVIAKAEQLLRAATNCIGMDVSSNESRKFKAQQILDGLGVKLVRGVIGKKGSTTSVGPLIFDVLAACKGVADLV